MFLRTSGRLVLLGALAVAACAVPAKSGGAERAPRSFSSLINVDALVDNYVRFVARKYNLTEEQDTYTEQLVRARVDEFLNRHYDELSDLVDKLVSVRNGGDLAPEELIDWGRRIQPIYQEAKGIIIQTNDEWRGILTEEQRRMHDDDVKLMYESFATTEDQLSRLTAGQMSVDEFRNPRAARQGRTPGTAVQTGGGAGSGAGRVGSAVRQMKAAGEVDPSVTAKKPGKSSGGGTTPKGQAVGESGAGGVTETGDGGSAARKGAKQRSTGKPGGSTAESQWEQYVRQFIERYKLNEEQTARAHKILKSCQDQAERYRRARAEQIEKLDQQEAALRTATDNPNKSKEQADITAQRAKLMAPIDGIFDKQLKPRLEKIPTRAQREAATKSGPADKDKDKAAASGKPAAGKTPQAGTPPPPRPVAKPRVAPPPQGSPSDGSDNPDDGEDEDDMEPEK